MVSAVLLVLTLILIVAGIWFYIYGDAKVKK